MSDISIDKEPNTREFLSFYFLFLFIFFSDDDDSC